MTTSSTFCAASSPVSLAIPVSSFSTESAETSRPRKATSSRAFDTSTPTKLMVPSCDNDGPACPFLADASLCSGICTGSRDPERRSDPAPSRSLPPRLDGLLRLPFDEGTDDEGWGARKGRGDRAPTRSLGPRLDGLPRPFSLERFTLEEDTRLSGLPLRALAPLQRSSSTSQARWSRSTISSELKLGT